MSLNYKDLKDVLDCNQKSGANTYIVPKLNFDGFLRDELMFVRSITTNDFTFFRSYDGKIYNINIKQLNRFKLVGR